MKKRGINSKKGISIMIGYVLLISAAVFMSFIVYQWMKSYIPKDTPECPDEVSILVTRAECVQGEDGINKIEVEIENNGLFSIRGYVINGKTEYGDIVSLYSTSWFFAFQSGDCIPGCVVQGGAAFGDSAGTEYQIQTIEIIPVRQETNDEGITQDALCGNSKITKKLSEICSIKINE
jgi:hypothetical protein